MKNNWVEDLIEKIFDKIFGMEDEKEVITFDKAKEFFEKLKENRTSFTIVKDPHKLLFAPYYLLWFDGDKITYQTYLLPESAVWQILLSILEISLPNENGLWAQEVPYKKIEEHLQGLDGT